METPAVSLIIPCLNEERCIGETLRHARAVFAAHAIDAEMIVVDNGCTDRTAEVAQAAGARVVHEPRRGYGAALQAGFRAARGEHVVMVDADLSYPLEELPRLLGPSRHGADLVIGNRLRGAIDRGAMPFLNRYLGTPFLSKLIRARHGISTYDCNSGFRVIARRALQQQPPWQSEGMEFASEMLIRAAHAQWNYAEVPIAFRRDGRRGPSHLRRWRDGWRHLRLILK